MSKRLTRKAIKRDIREDEFRSTVEKLIDWFDENQRQAIIAVGVVIGLGLLGSVVYAVMDSRRAEADERLAEAVKIINAPIDEQAADPTAKTPSYPNAEARRARAKEAFAEVADRSGDAADMATLYLADIALEEGDAEQARQHWERFLDRQGDHILSTSVRLNLIRLRRENGEADEVAEELVQALEGGGRVLPEDALLFELAQTLDELGRDDEAEEYYQRIVDEFPQSAFTPEARQALTASP